LRSPRTRGEEQEERQVPARLRGPFVGRRRRRPARPRPPSPLSQKRKLNTRRPKTTTANTPPPTGASGAAVFLAVDVNAWESRRGRQILCGSAARSAGAARRAARLAARLAGGLAATIADGKLQGMGCSRVLSEDAHLRLPSSPDHRLLILISEYVSRAARRTWRAAAARAAPVPASAARPSRTHCNRASSPSPRARTRGKVSELNACSVIIGHVLRLLAPALSSFLRLIGAGSRRLPRQRQTDSLRARDREWKCVGIRCLSSSSSSSLEGKRQERNRREKLMTEISTGKRFGPALFFASQKETAERFPTIRLAANLKWRSTYARVQARERESKTCA